MSGAGEQGGRKLRVGVIGGGYGRNHILAYRASGAEVAAFCQRSEAAAMKIAREFDIPNVLTDYRELLALDGLDAVSIAAPPHLHCPIAVEALARGLHVLCEKPLALSVKEAETMLGAAERAKRAHMTAFNFRFIPALRRMKELLDEGFVGARIFHVDATWFAEGRMAPDTPLGWRHRKETAGFGVLGDTAVHLIDLVRWLAGDFKKVSGQAAIFHKERQLPGGGTGMVDVEDSCMFLAELDHGIQASLHVSGVARGSLYQSIRIFGSEGALSLSVGRKAADWVVGKLAGARGANTDFAPIAIPERLTEGLNLSQPQRVAGEFLFAHLTRRFADAIRTGERAVPSFREGLEAQRVIDAVLRSIDERKWTDVV
jgi:predicted dehydrogenase